jgi:hypothetical protein
VREDDKGKTWWTKIGVAFENRNSDGFMLLFEALPIPNKNNEVRVVMKQPNDRDDTERSGR